MNRRLLVWWIFWPYAALAQSYTNPPSDFGRSGPYAVFADTFINPVYPTDSGGANALVVSAFHPNGSINGSLPTIFFAHGYTSPIGNANDYGPLLTNLASQGYNVIFSPYEGGLNPNIARRFDQLTTGFEAAVTNLQRWAFESDQDV
ncbi:MAG TPA: hypothetical protein VKY92_02345 [Verrucomicrobiae bacterium]|nr:hypothetical protein [Verrucomicrobiae bacterium]